MTREESLHENQAYPPCPVIPSGEPSHDVEQSIRVTRKADQSAEALAQAGIKAEQDFYGAAKDQGLWKDREFEGGDLGVEFNDAAEFADGAHRAGNESDERAPDWKQRAE